MVALLALVFSLYSAPLAMLESVGSDSMSYPNTISGTAVGTVLGTNGSAEVAVYQVNRYFEDGAAAMAFSTSYDGGVTWTEGLLPGLTKATNSANPWDRVTFATIAYDAKYKKFVVSVLPISNVTTDSDDDTTESPEVLTSPDGFTWSAPVAIESGAIRPEKNFVACDNFASSPHYGNCYVPWDDNQNRNMFFANASSDGGVTWGAPVAAADSHTAYGALPVVQPNGNVVVTSEDSNGYDGTAANMISFVSSDGGQSWSAANEISAITSEVPAGGAMRSQALPTSGVDLHGIVYTVWQDCRFQTSCSANDLVESTSPDGVNWSPVTRVAVDSGTTGADHFLPTLAVESSFRGTLLNLSYYGFPVAGCTVETCALYAYQTASTTGGASWTAPAALAGPMSLSSLASTSSGYMVGDYFQAIYRFGYGPYEAPLAVAGPPVNGVLDETAALSILGPVPPAHVGAPRGSAVRGGLSLGRRPLFSFRPRAPGPAPTRAHFGRFAPHPM